MTDSSLEIPLNMNSNEIKNVKDPVNTQEAATKKYVDDNTFSNSEVATFRGLIIKDAGNNTVLEIDSSGNIKIKGKYLRIT